MTDQELNEAVAKKMGYAVAYANMRGLKIPLMREKENKSLMTDGYSDVPNYCTDIGAAWKIVERCFSSFYLSFDECTETWFCRADCCRVVEDSCKWRSESDTAPRAICEAFLKMA